MKKTCFILCLCTCLFSLSACRMTTNKSIHSASGNMVSEERPVKEFHSVHASQGINVYIEKGFSDKLKVSASDNLIQYIETTVSNGILSIAFKPDIRIRNSGEANVYVKMENIEMLSVTSAAEIIGTTPFHVKTIRLEATSAGEISMELTAENIQVTLTSGADITLKGKAAALQATITSGADLTASALKVRTCDISLTSGSDAEVYVEENISYSVTSGADLVCKGHPKITKSHVSSGGDVKFK